MRLVVEFYRGLTSIQRSLIGACFGFVLYGGWAVGVNLMHGEDSAFRAGMVQGLYSFVLTFLMTLLIESTFEIASRTTSNLKLVVLVTVLISCALVFSGSWYVNHLAGTPEIFNTVILGYVLGGLYAIGYTIGLARQIRPVLTSQ